MNKILSREKEIRFDLKIQKVILFFTGLFLGICLGFILAYYIFYIYQNATVYILT